MIPIGMAREHKLPMVEVAPVSPDEIPEFLDALYLAFHDAAHPDDVALASKVLEPERTLAVRDGGRIVATTAIYSRRLTVPGGAELPFAAVAMVGVRASHRRRGLLTALMQRQLADVHEAGVEPLAALWASEGAIYGRFGYGLATLVVEMIVDKRDARLREPAAIRAELQKPAEARAAMAEIYEAARRERVGILDRAGSWWELRTADPEHRRDGASALHAAVIEGHAYAMYAVKSTWEDGRAEGRVVMRELVSATPEGNAAIWDYLLGLDLTRRVAYGGAALDDPLQYMVTEPHAVRMRVEDALWLRLVDVPRALAERAYAAPVEVVLEVADDVCPWNAGRWALRSDGAGAVCERSSAPAGLQLSAADLGAAYLGGTTLDALARAGRVKELRAGALAAASLAFRGEREPWCQEVF
jgi:predicted acetyltransferase